VPIDIEQSEKLNSIRLEGAVDIHSAAQLKAALVEAIEHGGTLHLSLGSVTALDVTAVQLLWAAARAARLAGVDIQLDSPLSDTLAHQLGSAGFTGFPLS